MESTIEKINGIVVITVQYEALDAKSAKELRQELQNAVDGTTQLLLDLSKVEFVDSAGLGAIVATLKTFRSEGSDMKICEIQKPVRTLFELVRMHKLVDIFNTRDEALQSY